MQIQDGALPHLVGEKLPCFFFHGPLHVWVKLKKWKWNWNILNLFAKKLLSPERILWSWYDFFPRAVGSQLGSLGSLLQEVSLGQVWKTLTRKWQRCEPRRFGFNSRGKVAIASYIQTKYVKLSGLGIWMLTGGCKHFLYFYPNHWGNDPIWRACFSIGLKPPTSCYCQSHKPVSSAQVFCCRSLKKKHFRQLT